VLTALSPMGPWTERGEVGRYANGTSISRAQMNFVIPVVGSAGQVTYVWTGDRWQSAPDRLKDHDFQTWLPLEWSDEDANTIDHEIAPLAPPVPMIKQMVWRDSFELDVAPSAVV